MKRYHETRFNTNKKIESPYEVGDQVLVLRPKETRTKLSLHYDGPFGVVKRLSGTKERAGNVYILKDDQGNEVVKPASDLKRFLPTIGEEMVEETRVEDTVEVLKDDIAEGVIPQHQKPWVDFQLSRHQ